MRGLTPVSVCNQLNRLLVFGATGQVSDQELLGRFVARREDAAFAVLVERHGPMVLGVCRRVLGNEQEAEDAFQATFLVLARKAASIARPEQLANWLFGVAARTALDARDRASRHRARERRAQAMARSQTKPADADQPALDELRSILDDELARLPERYRGALVLCELEGLTRRASARRLGIPEGTLSSRLARAKELLRQRLARRGLALSALALAQAFAHEAQARTCVVPSSLVDSTVQAATRVAAGVALAKATSTSIALLTRGVLRAMLVAKLTGIASVLAALAAITAGAGVLAQAPAPVAAPAAHTNLTSSVAVAGPPSVVATKRVVLPGSTALDPEHIARIRIHFAPVRVLELGRVQDPPQDGANPERRELRTGDRVKKGDLLAVLYSVDVASKKNDLLQLLVQLDLDQQVLDRVEKHREAVPEVFFLTRHRAVQGDRTEVQRALLSLKAWDIPQEEIDAIYAGAKKISADTSSWSQTPGGRWVEGANAAKDAKNVPAKAKDDPRGRVSLRAPIDGVIVEQNIHLGELVVDKTVNLFQIADVDRLPVTAHCPENDLPALAALRGDGRRWTVRAVGIASDAGLPGTIDEVGFVIDPNNHTAIIKGHVDNPGRRLRAGQFVTVTVDIPPDDVVEIPADAVVDDGKQTVVFVQSDPARHQFTMRRVEVKLRLDDKVLVRKTPIPQQEQRTAAEAEQGLLPKEPLRPGERVLRRGTAGSVENRLNTLERKVDQVLEALGAQRQPSTARPDSENKPAPK